MPLILGTKLEPSRLCLSTAGFGSDIPEREAMDAVDVRIDPAELM